VIQTTLENSRSLENCKSILWAAQGTVKFWKDRQASWIHLNLFLTVPEENPSRKKEQPKIITPWGGVGGPGRIPYKDPLGVSSKKRDTFGDDLGGVRLTPGQLPGRFCEHVCEFEKTQARLTTTYTSDKFLP